MEPLDASEGLMLRNHKAVVDSKEGIQHKQFVGGGKGRRSLEFYENKSNAHFWPCFLFGDPDSVESDF